MEGRCRGWRELGTDIAARHGIDAAGHQAPFLQHADIAFVESPEAFLREGRGRAQLAGAEGGERTVGLLEEAFDALEPLRQRHRVGELHALDAKARQGGDTAGILADAGEIAVAAAPCFNSLRLDRRTHCASRIWRADCPSAAICALS